MKNVIGNLIEIALYLQIAFGSIVIFTILILLIQEYGISLHLSSVCHLLFLSSVSYSLLHVSLLSPLVGLFLGILFFLL